MPPALPKGKNRESPSFSHLQPLTYPLFPDLYIKHDTHNLYTWSPPDLYCHLLLNGLDGNMRKITNYGLIFKQLFLFLQGHIVEYFFY